MKLVKESLYEVFSRNDKFLFELFSEEGDPIRDMGIGLLPKWEKELKKRYSWEIYYPESKDKMRINDIIRKADGDAAKERKLAATMCKLITDRKKAYRRFLAAEAIGGINWDVTQIFLQRAGELAGL